MKQIILSLIFIISAVFTYGQNTSVQQPTKPGMYLPDGSKLDEYKKTFEIKNNSNPDANTLSKIDVSKYWKLMNATKRVEVLDLVTNLTLILYSHEETKTKIDFNTLLIVNPTDVNRDEGKITP